MHRGREEAWGLGTWTQEKQEVCEHMLAAEPGSVTGELWEERGPRTTVKGTRHSVGMWPWAQSAHRRGQVTGEDPLRPAGLRVRSSGPRSQDLAEKVAIGTQRWPPHAQGNCLLDSQSQEVTARTRAQASCRLLRSGVLSAPWPLG